MPTDHHLSTLAAALKDTLSWWQHLPDSDRDAFATELAQAFLVSSSGDHPTTTDVIQMLREWKATAEIHADPELAQRLSEPLETPGDHPVPIPPLGQDETSPAQQAPSKERVLLPPPKWPTKVSLFFQPSRFGLRRSLRTHAPPEEIGKKR